MSDIEQRMVRFVKETALLRREIAQAEDFEEGITVTFNGRELAAVVYALALSYISEWVNGDNGHRKIMQMISDASATILAVGSSEEIDKAINLILGGKENPEEAGDGS